MAYSLSNIEAKNFFLNTLGGEVSGGGGRWGLYVVSVGIAWLTSHENNSGLVEQLFFWVFFCSTNL